MKKMLLKENSKDGKKWYELPVWRSFWQPYLDALSSPREDLRASVCTHVTPIIVKIDKSSLGYILQWLLENQKAEENGIGSLESLLTLLKIARQHKMVVFADNQLRLTSNEHFAIMQSDLLKILHTQNWKMSLACFSIVVEDTK